MFIQKILMRGKYNPYCTLYRAITITYDVCFLFFYGKLKLTRFSFSKSSNYSKVPFFLYILSHRMKILEMSNFPKENITALIIISKLELVFKFLVHNELFNIFLVNYIYIFMYENYGMS